VIEVTVEPSVEALRPSTATDLVGNSTAVALLQVVADPVRWTVLNRLAERPSCVCDLQEHVPIAANLLSYHLKILREAGLVSSSRRGRWIDYALTPDAWHRISAALPFVAGDTTS
jgi:ArsR family transcriptional regulator